MSLGHSHAQNSFGSVFPWGRGHGVSGLFSTVMAYPQSYGTRNHLQQFASPDQVRCEGQPCGASTSRDGGNEPDQSYHASFDVLLNNRQLASDSAQLWAWYVDNDGAHCGSSSVERKSPPTTGPVSKAGSASGQAPCPCLG